MGKYEEEIFEKTDIFTNHSLDCAEILGKNTIVECQKVYFLTLYDRVAVTGKRNQNQSLFMVKTSKIRPETIKSVALNMKI